MVAKHIETTIETWERQNCRRNADAEDELRQLAADEQRDDGDHRQRQTLAPVHLEGRVCQILQEEECIGRERGAHLPCLGGDLLDLVISTPDLRFSSQPHGIIVP